MIARNFYQKVWDKPLVKVAVEYCVSAVALGKACRKLAVPVPGRGHWAKLAHGQAGTKKPPLPKLEKVPIIHRATGRQLKQTDVDQNNPDVAVIDQLLSSGSLNPPCKDVVQDHVLVRLTANYLRSRNRKNDHGILLPREPGGLNVQVTERTLNRALQIMAQLLSILEMHNVSVEISEQGDTSALIQGQRVSFGIEEPIRKVVTQKPRVANPTDRWDFDKVVTFEPSGTLALVIHSDGGDTRALRKRWSDAKVQRIEKLIPEFVATLMRAAAILRQREEERKQRELEEQKKALKLEQLRKDIEEEEKKLEQFKRWLENWERAEQMRQFIAAYSEKSRSWPSEKQLKSREWIEWATRQADRVDPFVSDKPPSVLDRKPEVQRW